MAARLRVGVLGVARNVPFSLLAPILANPDLAARLEIVGVASLEKAEAEEKAKEWGIPKAYASFDEMLNDPQVDAIYNVLPHAVRCQWNVKAMQAGKHVLSETPLASNAREAVVAQRAAEDLGKVLLEGTAPTCHPVTKRAREMILEGKIGALEHIDLDLPIGHGLHGKMVCTKNGAMMSLGCHGVAIVRALSGEEPMVINASAQRAKENPEVDTAMSCNFKLPSGAGAHIGCSVSPSTAESPTMFTITGSAGTIRVKEWFLGSGKGSNEIELEQFEETGQLIVERMDNKVSRDTFYFMLMTFVDEVREQEKHKTVGLPWCYTKGKGPSDAVRNMALIDAVYRSANMKTWASTSTPPEPYHLIGMSKL